MSELKVHEFCESDEFVREYRGQLSNEMRQYYLKSEADKVIAELKEERDWLAKDRAQAYDDLEKRAQLNIKQESEIAELKAQKAQAEDDCAYWKMSEATPPMQCTRRKNT